MGNLIFILAAIYAYYFMRKVKKSSKGDGPLTRNEKIQVIITLFLSTMPAWCIYYIGWKKALPIKAKQVNRYLYYFIGALFFIAVAAIVVGIVLVAVRTAANRASP